MKKRHKSFLAFMLLAILLACEHEFPLSSFKATQRDLQCEVDRVRLWYDQNKPGLVQTKSGLEDELSITMAPNWSESFLREDEHYETVEVAAAMNKRVTYMTPEVRAKYFSTKELVYKQDMRRFVFLTDKKTNEMNCFVMLIVPDLDYLDKTDFKPFRKNTYLERDDDFSGYILYYELDGTYANGWRYANGELIQTVTETPYRYRGSRPEPIMTRSIDCSEVEMHILTEECTDHFTYVEFDGVTTELNYSHTTCVYYDEVTGSYLRCEDRDGDHKGGGGYQPPTDPVDPTMGEYGDIYSSQSSLSNDEKQNLVGALDALISFRPLYDNLLDLLRAEKIKITFKIGETVKIDDYWVPAIYRLDRSITFIDKSSIATSEIEEELFHAVQHLKYGGMLETVLNYELEAKFFRDVLTAIGAPGGLSAKIYLPPSEHVAYEIWINEFRSRPFVSSDMIKLEDFAKKSIDPRGIGKYQSGFPYTLIKEYLFNYYY